MDILNRRCGDGVSAMVECARNPDVVLRVLAGDGTVLSYHRRTF